MARYRLQIYHLTPGREASGGVLGRLVRLTLALGLTALVLILLIMVGWFVLLALAVISVPFLIRAWYAQRMFRHPPDTGPAPGAPGSGTPGSGAPESHAPDPAPPGSGYGSRILEGEWRPIEDHPLRDDGQDP